VPAPPERSTLSLHDALPISGSPQPPGTRSLSTDPDRASGLFPRPVRPPRADPRYLREPARPDRRHARDLFVGRLESNERHHENLDRKSTRLNSSHLVISYAV